MINRQKLELDYGLFNSYGINKNDILFYARVLPKVDIYEILELKVRTVMEGFFVGTDKNSKQAFLFEYDDLNKIIFKERKDALKVVKDAEKDKKIVLNKED